MKIVEVGPRDGLQNESNIISIEHRVQLIEKLAASGLKQIEVGAFVSKKWVPQMEGTEEVCQQVLASQKKGKIPADVRFSVLTPNVQGLNRAMDCGIKEVSVFGSCSEVFSKKNINCSIAESFDKFSVIIKLAKKNKVRVRGYLSMAFGCPYEGAIPVTRVKKLTQKMIEMGISEVSIGDTTGVATPYQVDKLLAKLLVDVPKKTVAMHFHDTRGMALANVWESYQWGIRTFDSSLGGLGGCPYANGATGNLATEDLAYLMRGMGLKNSVEIKKLLPIAKWAETIIGRPLPSRVSKAGLGRGC